VRHFGKLRNEMSWEYIENHMTEEQKAGQIDTYPVHVSEMLEKRCKQSIELLHHLQRPVTSKTEAQDASRSTLPVSALRFSKALAFLWRWKAGVMGSLAFGHGFVIYQLAEGIWSAPVFLKDRYVSFGLTFGFKKTQSVFAVPNDSGIVPLLKDILKSTVDFDMMLGPEPLELEGGPKTVVSSSLRGLTLEAEAKSTKTYSRIDGGIIDISWRCGFEMQDEGLNSILYGSGASHRDILDGHVQIPVEMRPLYEVLRRTIEPTDACCADTVSQFQFEKEKNFVKIARSSAVSSSTGSEQQQRWLGRTKSTNEASSLESTVNDRSSIDSARNSLFLLDQDSHLHKNSLERHSAPLFGEDLLDLDLGPRDDDENGAVYG
jgi:lipid-binding SYLF domain-containing protein